MYIWVILSLYKYVFVTHITLWVVTTIASFCTFSSSCYHWSYCSWVDENELKCLIYAQGALSSHLLQPALLIPSGPHCSMYTALCHFPIPCPDLYCILYSLISCFVYRTFPFHGSVILHTTLSPPWICILYSSISWICICMPHSPISWICILHFTKSWICIPHGIISWICIHTTLSHIIDMYTKLCCVFF